MKNVFFHVYCAGFTKHFQTLGEAQIWLDSNRESLAGEVFKAWRVVDCLAEQEPCISGTVTP